MTRHNVIPAPYQARGKLQRESSPVLDTGVGRGFLVKPGMTKQGECLYNCGLISTTTLNLFKKHCKAHISGLELGLEAPFNFGEIQKHLKILRFHF